MDLGLDGKRAIVAASSAGLGLGAARALAGDGARVAICGRRPDILEEARAGLGDGAVAIRADLSTPEGATDFANQAVEHLGGVDILITNSGGPPAGGFGDTSLQDYQYAIDLNLFSAIALCQALVPAMCEQGWGRVVAITSIGARQPIPKLHASTVARAGITSYMKMLATEVAPDGVTVNTVQPGLHLTDRVRALGDTIRDMRREVPTGTIGDPGDFGAVCAFLCSEQARFVTGASIPVDGGESRSLL